MSAVTENNDNPLFELWRLRKSFSGSPVLNGLDLKIARGQTTVIIGPSGCGKTVLLKHLIVLLRPDRGKVYFDGERIDKRRESTLHEVRKRIGFLFQSGALFDSQTVAQNVAFPLLQHTNYSPDEIDQLVRDKLELVGMSGFEERLPIQLSGGQQRRVALARAIALAPEAILYDEPTTGLDPIRADSINNLIIKLQRLQRITTVVVTHDMASAYKIADRIIMLDQGAIIADGAPREIREHPSEIVQRFIQGRSQTEEETA